MGLFKKKVSDEEAIQQNIQAQQAEAEQKSVKKDSDVLGDSKLAIEITKLKAQIEGFQEVRKANADRFQRVSEQMGELRGMIVDTNKMMSRVEVASTKAIDLVESVQPEKLMVQVRKQEGKTEALKANIESNESIMKDIMKELKDMRKRMTFYKGLEQVLKLNEDTKKELSEIKKVQAVIERHSDKVETIFLDVGKKFAEFDKFNDVVKDIDRSFRKMQSDFDKLKIRVDDKADKKEFVQLVDKFDDFEKHTSHILKLLDQRSRNVVEDLTLRFKQLTEQLSKKEGAKVEIKESAAVKENVSKVGSLLAKFGRKKEEPEQAEAEPAERVEAKPEEKK
jgi:hypothetical protein